MSYEQICLQTVIYTNQRLTVRICLNVSRGGALKIPVAKHRSQQGRFCKFGERILLSCRIPQVGLEPVSGVHRVVSVLMVVAGVRVGLNGTDWLFLRSKAALQPAFSGQLPVAVCCCGTSSASAR